jgi:Ca-activated chloride channel homolog
MRYIFVFFMAFNCSLFAQQLSPRLVAVVGNEIKPVQLSKLDVNVKIFGEIAETRTTMTFYNPYSLVLEGNLNFPLPEGVSINGYALDVNGVMVDGVVVEKNEARRVFEREERKGIDPGLAEWVKGNNFHTRVYPIPANGSRTVMVRYLSELPIVSGRTSYRLFLNYTDKIEQFHLRMEAIRASSPPLMTQGSLADFSFSASGNSYVAETTLKDAVLNEDLLIGLPGVEKAPVWVEKSANGQYHFAINDYQAASFDQQIAKRPHPSRITLYWDASGSRGNIDHKRELALLEMHFKRWKSAPVEVDLILFRNKAEPSRKFSIVGGNTATLLDALRATDYDGGTQMAAISAPAGQIAPDFYLLFTDGLSNFGNEKPAGFKAPLYVISADPTSNHSFLTWLAMTAQGQYFNLAQMDDKTVADSIGLPVYRFMAARYDSASIKDAYPKIAEPVHGRFILTGALTAPSAAIVLEFGAAGRVLRKVRYVVQKQNASEGDMLETLWAQKKIKELSVFPENNRRELLAIGKQYSLVTPGTSMLVLERLEQYVEYNITPPASLPEMRERYLEEIALRNQEKKVNKIEKLERIRELWDERVNWWKTHFEKTKKISPAPSGVAPVLGGGDAYGSGPSIGFGSATGIGSGSAGGSGPGTGGGGVLGGVIGSGSSGAPASPDRVDEFKVVLSPADAEYGRGGPQIILTSKLGSGLYDSAEDSYIAIRGWDPDTPYIEELKKAAPNRRLEVYMRERKHYSDSPAFFLDCSDFFIKHKQTTLGLRILSNIAELQLENPEFLRILAHRLEELGQMRLSVPLFETILKMRPEEPQSYRDLALALTEQKKYKRAMELLNHLVMTQWDRFDGIEVIALMELNRIIPLARAQGIKAIPLDPRLIRLLDVDARIVLSWDADMTDIDLWVTEPSGEVANYGNHLTSAGGQVSNDFTEGYGPEEYVIHHAAPGEYLIQVNYFGSNSPTLQGPVTVHADVYTNYGRKNEKRQRLTLRLTEEKETFTIGKVKIY